MEYRSVLYYKNRLPQAQRAVYDSLLRQWSRMEPVIELPAGEFALADIARGILYDCPVLFYANYYSLSYTRSPNEIRLQGDYLYSRPQARALLRQLEQWGQAVVAQLPPTLPQELKARRLHRFLAQSVTYGHTEGRSAYNVVGVIRDKTAVCEGIAKAYKYLCDLAGIPCIVVSGTVDGGRHGWNKLWIDGKPCFVDVTNSMAGTRFAGRFRLTEQELGLYSWDQTLVPIHGEI